MLRALAAADLPARFQGFRANCKDKREKDKAGERRERESERECSSFGGKREPEMQNENTQPSPSHL